MPPDLLHKDQGLPPPLPLTLGEQAKRLREACELLRAAHPEHAAACLFAAAMLEASGESPDFRR